MYRAASPIMSSTGFHLSNTSSSPPHQIASLPLAAPRGPPLTGASSRCAPFAAKASCALRTTVGEFVVRSKYAAPCLMPASSPAVTASNSGGPGSEVKITSLCSATACGKSAQIAPSRT